MGSELSNNNNGFTLIEIIIGIALFGIISISLITLFTNGFTYISRSGRRTEALYTNQKAIETNLVTSPTAGNITFTFDGVDVDIDIYSFQVEEQYDAADHKTSVTYFEADLSGF